MWDSGTAIPQSASHSENRNDGFSNRQPQSAHYQFHTSPPFKLHAPQRTNGPRNAEVFMTGSANFAVIPGFERRRQNLPVIQRNIAISEIAGFGMVNSGTSLKIHFFRSIGKPAMCVNPPQIC
jgi:hypothetical protein